MPPAVAGRALGLVLFIVAGCAGSAPTGELPPAPALVRDRASVPSPEEVAPPPADRPLTLTDALDAALTRSPRLGAPVHRAEEARALARQAARRPNPELEAEVENVAGTGAFSGTDAAETSVGISQLLELGGKRAGRATVAGEAARRAAWASLEARLDVLTTTEAAFIRLLAAQEEVRLADELVRLAGELVASVERRVTAGAASPVEIRQAEVERERARVDVERARRQLDAARRRMAATWGEHEPRFPHAEGDLEARASLPPLDEVLVRAVASPHLTALRLDEAASRANAAGARALRWPDLTLSAGMRHEQETGDVGLRLGLAAPLPLFDRNQDGVRAAEHRVALTRAELAAARVALQVQVATLHAEADASHAEILALRDRALPAARAAFTDAQDAYRRGRFRLADVLDVERSLFDLERQRVAALVRFHLDVVAIERLLGESLHSTHDDPGRP